MRMVSTLAAAILLMSGVSMPAAADDAPTKVRQELMKSVGKATKAAGSMVKGETDFDAAAAQEAMAAIHKASVDFGELFPAGSETGDETEASPKIWSDAAGWQEALTTFQDASVQAAASAPADLDAFKASFGQVAKNCKACHEGYRIKKD